MKVRVLSESLQAKAVKELNENPAKVEEDVKVLREWLKKQPHLTAREDDHFLLCFLRGCKFSLQKAKQKIDYFYTVRGMLQEYYKGRDPFSPDIQLVLNAGCVLPLPKSDGPDGPRVIIFRWEALNPSTMPFALLIKVLYMIVDVLMEEDDNIIVSGVYFLPDYKNFSAGYTLHLTPTNIHKACIGIQSAYPLRLKGMDFINVPSFFDTIYSILKPILTPKLRERTKVFTNNYAPGLYDRIPQSILPKDYGGLGCSCDELKDIWIKKLESYQQWFKDDEKYCCNEALRPEDSKSDVFGADGTFRKLNID